MSRLTDQQNAWIMKVWGAAPGRDRLAVEKARLEQELDEARTEVANAFVQWAMKNETAEPPLDWAWFGEIARRYSPLHADYAPSPGAATND